MFPRGGEEDGTPPQVVVSAAAEVSAAAAEVSAAAAEETSSDPVVTTIGSDTSLVKMILDTTMELSKYLKGAKADTMILLLSTALNAPLCAKLGVSPILGFLGLGLVFGPNGRGLIKDVHTTEMLADLGIVLFLFEMGLHLDLKTLTSMKKDVFGIGLTQFTATAVVIGALLTFTTKNMSSAAAIIVGWSLALSSSAFVLQLLKDKDEMSSQYGRSSFGTLLLQDLMVVPLLVITPILAGGGNAKAAVTKALLQSAMALTAIFTFGKVLLHPLFALVTNSNSQEAMIGMILSLVLGFSFLTEGLGLSNTLGPFLAGMMVAETPFKHRVEQEASPYRGILVGLFFFTVGFEIDVKLITSKFGIVMGLVVGLIAIKATLATLACLLFQIPFHTAQRVGLVLSQGGEFAFVAFRTARSNGILDDDVTKLLLTVVSLTMALTPFTESVGAKVAHKLLLVQDTDEQQHNKKGK